MFPTKGFRQTDILRKILRCPYRINTSVRVTCKCCDKSSLLSQYLISFKNSFKLNFALLNTSPQPITTETTLRADTQVKLPVKGLLFWSDFNKIRIIQQILLHSPPSNFLKIRSAVLICSKRGKTGKHRNIVHRVLVETCSKFSFENTIGHKLTIHVSQRQKISEKHNTKARSELRELIQQPRCILMTNETAIPQFTAHY